MGRWPVTRDACHFRGRCPAKTHRGRSTGRRTPRTCAGGWYGPGSVPRARVAGESQGGARARRASRPGGCPPRGAAPRESGASGRSSPARSRQALRKGGAVSGGDEGDVAARSRTPELRCRGEPAQSQARGQRSPACAARRYRCRGETARSAVRRARRSAWAARSRSQMSRRLRKPLLSPAQTAPRSGEAERNPGRTAQRPAWAARSRTWTSRRLRKPAPSSVRTVRRQAGSAWGPLGVAGGGPGWVRRGAAYPSRCCPRAYPGPLTAGRRGSARKPAAGAGT